MKPPRVCKECLAIIPSGRCICKSVRPRTYDKVGCWDSDLEARHFYHLIKSIRSGSWARTGYRAPRNPQRESLSRLYQDLNGSFTISRAPRRPHTDWKRIKWFVFRCEISHQYERDEFAGLMATRMTIWMGGCDNRKTADFLQLSLEKLRELDDVIRHEYKVHFPVRQVNQSPAYLKARRRMKAGVAADILRRYQHGYFHGKVLTPEQVNPFSAIQIPIIEEKKLCEIQSH